MSPPGPFDGPGGEPGDNEETRRQFEQMAAAFSSFLAMGSGSTGVNWDQARSMAAAIAANGEPEANVDPLDRMQLEALVRVAELQIAELTGFTTSGVRVGTATRSQWAGATIDHYRPMLERVSESLTRIVVGQLSDLSGEELDDVSGVIPGIEGLDLAQMLAGLGDALGPALTVSLSATVVGQLASRAFGTYDLPLPRPVGSEISVILTALDQFGRDWSLPLDDLRLWWSIHEIAHHLVLGLPHVGARVTELLAAHAAAFDADPAGIEAALGPFDPDDPDMMTRLGELMSEPDRLLTTLRSPEQGRLVAEIDTAVSCIEGYVDWVVDSIADRLLSDADRISEALRRRRVQADGATRFVERIFGLELTQAKIDLGAAFVTAIDVRHGPIGVERLWSSGEHLPTRAELETPGLWMARVGLADTEALPELDDNVEIPDFPEL